MNALLVSWLASALNAQLELRIDDMDRERYRPEYVDDILATVDWLGLSIDSGPSTRDEFEAHFSLRLHQHEYWDRIAPLDCAYACTCSRQEQASGRTCTCRSQRHPLVTGQSALRIIVPDDTLIAIDGREIRLHDAMGDFVLWRRDGTASYQLASLLEDERRGITHIVRGADLRDSTAAQRFLAGALDCRSFLGATVIHHDLITAPDGSKLSKSQSTSGPMERTTANLERIRSAARLVAASCGISAP